MQINILLVGNQPCMCESPCLSNYLWTHLTIPRSLPTRPQIAKYGVVIALYQNKGLLVNAVSIIQKLIKIGHIGTLCGPSLLLGKETLTAIMFTQLKTFSIVHLRLLNAFWMCPYKWPRSATFPERNGRIQMFAYKLNLLVHAVYVGVMIPYYVVTAPMISSTGSKLVGLVFLDCLTVTLSMRSVFFWKEGEGLAFLATFLHFENNNPQGAYQLMITRGNISLISFICLSCFSENGQGRPAGKGAHDAGNRDQCRHPMSHGSHPGCGSLQAPSHWIHPS